MAAGWPDPVDRLTILCFVAGVVLLPIIGYWLTVLDIRAYLRALKGVLMRIAEPATQAYPAWATDETPPCLRALGLSLPCTEEDVKQAYRRLAKEMHPDRGGDVQRFLLLKDHHDQARYFLRQRAK